MSDRSISSFYIYIHDIDGLNQDTDETEKDL